MDIENLMTAKIPPRTAFMTTLPAAATHSYGCFSHNSESLAPLIQSKKESCCFDFINYCKGKSDRIVKSEKLFWFLLTLIAFVVAYIILMMQTDFLMANACVHK